MKLNKDIFSYSEALHAKGYELPEYDVEKIKANTAKRPEWIHFGAGNIFRAFIADIYQQLLNAGLSDTGIIAAEGFDYDIIDTVYRPFDNLSLLAVLNCDGTTNKKIIASVTESLKADKAQVSDWKRLCEIFSAPSLKAASFTITEKGYAPALAKDKNSMLYKLTELCLVRFKAGAFPIALVSMDNCSRNGDKLKAAVLSCAHEMNADEAFTAYLSDENKVSFPCSMIDKITPRPDNAVKNQLEADGFEDMDTIITDKNTYTAAFVNAEKPQYLVIEDKFPASRPPLERAGVIFTDGATVDKAEKMKVCTCLNPLHTSLAIFGCLLGYTSISEEMKDGELAELVRRIGYDEGLPVVVNPEIINPRAFIDEVIENRLVNPFIPDTPQRIACDTSQKLPIRFGQTIKEYMKSGNTSKLKFIPLVIAGWCRYLTAVDDMGNAFIPSPDPMLSQLLPIFENVKPGDKINVHELLQPVLSNAEIFAVDLYEAKLAALVEEYFAQMISSVGAVRATLKAVLSSAL